MVLLVFWIPQPWQQILWGLTAAIILAIILDSFDNLKTMGLCRENLSCSLWAVFVALGVAAVAVTAARMMHTLQVPGNTLSFLRHSFAYALWASIQQLVLQCFFLSRLMRLIGSGPWAAGAAAILFAIAHLPSPFLMLVTLVCGLAACLFFLRYRSLYPLVIAHAILGIVIAITVPERVDHQMRVGLAYLTYSSQQPASLSQP